MSLYDLIFSKNPISDLLLATIGRKREDFRRFRDAHLDAETHTIAVYTRVGGGNRDCWCHDDEGTHWANHDSPVTAMRTRMKMKTTSLPGGMDLSEPTGEMETAESPVCISPNSAECGCHGCWMRFVVPDLPFYVHDSDDTFDTTYATIYFSYPPEYADKLRQLEDGNWEPDKRWEDAIKALEQAGKT